MKKIRLIGCILVLALCSGCSGMSDQQKGTTIGAGVGAVVGSAFGGGAGKVITTAAGAAAGGYIGNQVGKSMDQKNNN